MSDQPIRISYVFDEDVFLQAHRALWEKRRQEPRSRLFGLLWAAGLPLSTWLMLQYGMVFTFLAVVGGNLVYWIFDWPITRTILRRRFPNMPGANARFTWEISEEGLKVKGANGEGGLIRWQDVRALQEEREGFLLAQDYNVNQWLPKAAFRSEEDVQAFRALIARRVKTDAASAKA